MSSEYNIYCDESCHLLNDHSKVFILGAVWVEKEKAAEAFKKLRSLKEKYGLPASFEAKWTKISRSKQDYYCELVKCFFEDETLHFRGVVVPDKDILDHQRFNQDHNTWYYKMFYVLLNVIVKSDHQYNLYLDIKDTRSHLKVLELKRILNITKEQDLAISNAQQIRSHEVELMQVVDILCGALAYIHRNLSGNEGKKSVVELIKNSIGKSMLTSSSISEDKFNVLVWESRKN